MNSARVGLAALAAAAVLGGCDQVGRGAHDATRDAAAVSLDQVARDNVIGQLRADFPQDYARMRAQVSEMAASGQGQQAIEAASKRFMIDFGAAHEPDLERAPDADLVRVAKGELDMLQAAHAISDAACVGIWAEGRPPPYASSPPAFQAALTAFGRARIRAIRAGIDTPTQRPPPSPLAPADRAAMLALATRSGASAQEIAEKAQATPATRCRAGLAIRTAVPQLPPDQAARVEAYFMHTEMTAAPA